ncbi:ABC transporter ATP-binding protein/permease, partial [Legionella septentrionalis]|uniref:ABC transporter ATP-binding protein/permease n=1 Tax=Legionella septentrionalis TaxID=2498109 RepID=UPI000F95BDAD
MQNHSIAPEATTSTWSNVFSLFKDYFIHSDEKLRAWALLIGTGVCVVGLVALMAAFSWWSAGFWAVLTAKALTPFLISMGQFSLILGAFVGISVLKNFLIQKLSILWRSWLTKKITSELFESENNYLELKRFSPEIDNISQRIQEDVKSFVDLALNLGADLLNSVLTLATFVGTLWIVGGPLAFTLLGLNVVIPGYLVWVALILAVSATLMTHLIGKSLPAANQHVEKAEADLRQELVQLNEEAENIAEEHAENYYKTTINNQIEEIKISANEKLNTDTGLIAFQSFYSQSAGILPNLLAAPLYFSGLIEIGQLMQIGLSFTQVSMSLSWFANTYENLSKIKASIERITELKERFEKEGLQTSPKEIVRKVRDKDSLKVKGLNIAPPRESTDYILRNLSLKFMPGEHVLIKGASGLGKSSIFKAIAGTWKYGEGKISIPSGKSLYFLPQKPTIPNDTLKAVLAYPEPVTTYAEEQYSEALMAVGRMEHFISRLDEKRNWSKELSGGQQQKIAFARVLLKKPDWLFLDEATSSLDEESEEHVYKMVKALKTTTIISIAHRTTVEKHHSKIVFFNAN